MFKKVKKPEINIAVDLEDPLTAPSCSELIIELIKYVMYQKQQIPFSGDTLIKLLASTKTSDRNFSSMNKLSNTLESISKHLTLELNLDECDVKEILIVIGATIISPKLCIKLELPNILSKAHIPREHPHRKTLMSIMRSILECNEFQEELSTPLLPTNTFVLLQKKDSNKTSEFFIPKPQFAETLSKITCLNIKLNFNENQVQKCSCKNLQSKFSIYHDVLKYKVGISEHGNKHRSEELTEMKKARHNESNVPYMWYQSKEVFKGFKFVK